MKYATGKRWLPLLIASMFLIILLVINTRSDLNSMGKAEISLKQKDFSSLSASINAIHRISLILYFDKPGRLNFLKGTLAFQQQNNLLAAEYFKDVPQGSEYYVKSQLSRAEISLDQGHWRLAEEITIHLIQVLSEDKSNKADCVAALKLLDRYYRMQGRFDDAAALLLEIAEFSDNPITPLREYWRTIRGTMPIELITKSIKICESLSPDDSRLWLAKSNVAIELSDFKAAEIALQKCEQKSNHPDYAVLKSRIKYAIASNSTHRLIENVEYLIKTDRLSSGQLLSLADDIANLFNVTDTKKSIFEIWQRVEPDNPQFLARMAAFLSQSSDNDLVKTINQRKSRSEKAHEAWQKLILSSSEPLTKDQFLIWINSAVDAGEIRVAAVLTLYAMRKIPGNTGLNDISQNISTKLQILDDNKLASRNILTKIIQSVRENQTLHSDMVKGDAQPLIPRYELVPAKSGFVFKYDNGETQIRQMPVALGGGSALIDFDKDGLLDIFAVQGGSLPHDPSVIKPGDRLFRNLGQMQFQDVTRQLNLPDQVVGYGLGVAVADVNNDTWPDLFITRFGSYALYLNENGQRFTDGTRAWHLDGDRDWPSSAAFADFDNDGDLDLYVCHYVVWNASEPRICRHAESLKFMSCNPTSCDARPDHLFRNDGNQFTDISDLAGITAADKEGRGLGVIAADFNADGLMDIFVANDKSANFLFKNLGDMKFEEMAHPAGVAAGADGSYQAGMGVACADFNGDGRPDIAVTNYYGESTTLYQNTGDMVFIDRTAASGIGAASRLLLGFGISFLDSNNDGLLDLVSTNGHTDDFGDVPYQMPAQLLLGRKSGRFFDASTLAGPELARPRLGRGLAIGDMDNDGRIDLLFLPQNEPAALLANKTQSPHHWLSIRLVGQKSNRDGVGVVARLVSGNRQYHASRFGGGSYQSASDPRLHFAWPVDEKAMSLEIRWPSGKITKISDPPANRVIEVDEFRGYNQAAYKPELKPDDPLKSQSN